VHNGHHHARTGHDQAHRAASSEEGSLAPSGEASVVLDIGPHAGALVLYAGPDLAGAEIEIRPGGSAWTGTHTAVRARHVAGGVLHAGVFGSLAEGPYDARLKGGGPGSFALRVEVAAGSVTEATVPPGTALPGVPRH
jgi:hypothetical protein